MRSTGLEPFHFRQRRGFHAVDAVTPVARTKAQVPPHSAFFPSSLHSVQGPQAPNGSTARIAAPPYIVSIVDAAQARDREPAELRSRLNLQPAIIPVKPTNTHACTSEIQKGRRMKRSWPRSPDTVCGN